MEAGQVAGLPVGRQVRIPSLAHDWLGWALDVRLTMAVKKKLRRSADNRTMFGVLGGVGEYFDIDPVIVRVGYVLLTAFSGFLPGIIAYIVLVLVVPE